VSTETNTSGTKPWASASSFSVSWSFTPYLLDPCCLVCWLLPGYPLGLS
jgi:hypothetical protein